MIASVDGVYTVYADITSGNLNVEYDPVKTSPEELAQKIRDRGYHVDSIKLMK